jgi:hypothetical protein
MRRREFIAGLGSAVAWPVAARGQQGDRIRRIGVLMPYAGATESRSGPRDSLLLKNATSRKNQR